MGKQRTAPLAITINILEQDVTASREMLDLVAQTLPDYAVSAKVFAKASVLMDKLRCSNAQLMIIDLDSLQNLDQMSAFASLSPKSLVIAVSRQGSMSRMMEAMQAGAHEFFSKPLNLEVLEKKLLPLVQRYFPQNVELAGYSGKGLGASIVAEQTKTTVTYENYLGKSTIMQTVDAQLYSYATAKKTVFFSGEKAVGKELCATTLHKRSRESDRPLIVIDCAGLAKERIEQELNYHLSVPRPDLVAEEPNTKPHVTTGTLLLLEVATLDSHLQSVLLKCLQAPRMRNERTAPRIISTTSKNIRNLLEAGDFNRELYALLSAHKLQIPALKERQEDIEAIATALLNSAAVAHNKGPMHFSRQAIGLMESHPWHGNLGELETVIDNIMATNHGERVEKATLSGVLSKSSKMLEAPVNPTSVNYHLTDVTTKTTQAISPIAVNGTKFKDPIFITGSKRQAIEPLWFQEKRIIEETLATFDGNIAMAAAALEISPSTIYRKKQSWAEKMLS
ncbi:sigma-54-dependent transcriptional regulator [Polycladidibacter stylochi]|uniref:sigma-54-dependent transcriptional regulator n=1 Tax=Polycladidibacter stylochi TaxID=1807766 RepID=UPI00083359A2|nr:sigma 54-interacting transcriptional regulator [Pseudovibrio stylochi]